MNIEEVRLAGLLPLDQYNNKVIMTYKEPIGAGVMCSKCWISCISHEMVYVRKSDPSSTVDVVYCTHCDNCSVKFREEVRSD